MTGKWAFLVLFLSADCIYPQSLEVLPSRALADQSPSIRVTGVPPNEHVEIQADLTDGADQAWHSQAEFVADARGVVDLSQQAPVKGSYKKASAAGLIWSMMPAGSGVNLYQGQKELGPQTIHFKLMRDGKIAASADFEQLSIAEGVHRVDLKGALHGILFEPAGNQPHPGVLVLGGSEGGVPARNAAWLASHGYAALALAYFRYEDLPKQLEAIPLEYFGMALNWMMSRPEISKDHIAVMGVSRGGELALQLGSMYQVQAVVAFVPANTRHGSCCTGFNSSAWTWQKVPLSYTTGRSRGPMSDMAAQIPVENTPGPILLISGQDDAVWESSRMSDEIIGRLKRAHFKFEFEQLKYAHAGHRAGHPGILPTWHGRIQHPVSGRDVHYGGTPEGNAESSIDAPPKVLEFLGKSLKL